ncbi:enoyl-CoA hydratase/isomerase family protein [Salinisphaera aquimarina]|uniref:Enoyl-CoA hydratase/isomerase family protein n=1 Tax=Salinisphaera aquimarina TaxID=2094031 RepID=A0ABV7ENC1_9GAMM
MTYEVRDSVATLRLNRPDALNAINSALRESLLGALQRAERDPAVKVVLLGATGRGFCAGADLMEEQGADFSVEEELLQGYRPIFECIGRMPQPVIGVAPGVAAGIGAALLMACDLVIMADQARLYMAFSHVGLVPDGGATWLLYRHLGYQRAFALIVEGGSLGAEECRAAGIANKIVAAEALDEAANAWAQELATRSPVASAEAKRLLRTAATHSYAEIFEQEAAAQHRCINSEQSRAAVAAFKDRARARQ